MNITGYPAEMQLTPVSPEEDYSPSSPGRYSMPTTVPVAAPVPTYPTSTHQPLPGEGYMSRPLRPSIYQPHYISGQEAMICTTAASQPYSTLPFSSYPVDPASARTRASASAPVSIGAPAPPSRSHPPGSATVSAAPGPSAPPMAALTPSPPPPPSPPMSPTLHVCEWTEGGRCCGLAPGRNREMGEHLRTAHGFVGNERDTVYCRWGVCGRALQRMNMGRHIVSTHLRATATCPRCFKTLSRPDVAARHEKQCGR